MFLVTAQMQIRYYCEKVVKAARSIVPSVKAFSFFFFFFTFLFNVVLNSSSEVYARARLLACRERIDGRGEEEKRIRDCTAHVLRFIDGVS